MAYVEGTNNSETINLLDGVTPLDDFIVGLGGDDSIFGLADWPRIADRIRARAGGNESNQNVLGLGCAQPQAPANEAPPDGP
jgi:hypothetical protein